jgi:sugar lactone lactonase YvrE
MSVCEQSDVRLLLDAKAIIGESPLWVEAHAALFWIDVKAPAFRRTDLDARATKSWALPSDVGGYALKPDGGGAVVGLRSGIFDLDFSTGTLEKLCDPPFDPRVHRFNEGDCDPSGRLWLGTMFDPDPDSGIERVKGHLYSFTLDGGLVRHDDLALLHNGFAWNRDGSEMIFAHSREGRIYAREFDLVRGTFGRKRVFAEVPKRIGIPDGGAFDQDGCYWCAIHKGGRLHRYTPDGCLERVVMLPVQNPTMVAFCGPDLRDLCITSATHGKPGKPYEGGIFRMRPGVAGLPRRAYLGRFSHTAKFCSPSAARKRDSIR